MNLGEVTRHAGDAHLAVFGAFHPRPEDKAPAGTGTLVLLGPREPGFWDMFSAAPERLDGAPDPLDRWSERVISRIARDLGANAYFPFGGPPFQPFIRWAHGSGRAHQSPVGLLVHDSAGLMLSYRGALAFEAAFPVPAAPPSPCETCATQPCRTACPANAFAMGFYDVPTCRADLDRPGNDCRACGCAVRRACPVSQRHGRHRAQSAFHMAAFG